MIIHFTILGNHKDPKGNPIPKAKLTRGQQWTDKAQEYSKWKQYVQQAIQPHLIGLARDMPMIPADKMMRGGGRYIKPITLSEECEMELVIWWANEKHGDPEGIFGSIADALFVDDKHLAGSFTAIHSPNKKGRVDVTITIPELSNARVRG